MATGKIAKVVQDFMKSGPVANGFAQHLKKVNILCCCNGTCDAEMKIEPEMCNSVGTLHGGFSPLLLDNLTSYALISHPKKPHLGVSVDMHTMYLKAAKLGTTVSILAEVVKIGKTLAFLDMKITEKDTGDLIVKGCHIKFIGLKTDWMPKG